MFCRKTFSCVAGKLLLLVSFAPMAMIARPAFSQDEATVQHEFRDPAKQYRPMVRWWWPGADVTDNEIQREIGLLDAAGFGGAEIQPFVTFDTRDMPKEEAVRVNEYASPRFFQHVRAAADAAKARGMWIDYTFGSGWPFGGGLTVTPELSAIELRSSDTVVDGPKAFSGKLTIPNWQPGLIASMMLHAGMKPDWPADWQERFDARSRVVAVVAMRGAPASENIADKPGPRKPEMLDRSSAVILTDRMQPDGTLDWQVPSGTWHIFVFRKIPTRQPVIGASGTGPELVLDHLNKAAFAAHAARVGDPLVKAAGSDIGSSLRAIFCDSLELQQYVFWSDDFIEQFKRRRGYDLTPYLAILRQPGYNDFYFSHPGGLPLFDVSDGGDAIRSDYWKTVSELIFEGFYHPFDEWAKQHNLLSRVQAHGAPADLLKVYGDANIPETEELDGNNTVNFMKLASSAGYDYGRKIISSESFVFRGNPYVTTPESIKANSDKLLISGINEIIYHGFPYDFDDGTKALGWFPFQGQFSSHINEHNPIWPFIGKVNGYITRLQYIAQKGTSDLQVALFRSSLNEEDTGPTPASGLVKDPFPAIEDSLTSAGYSFGFISEDVLLGSVAKASVLTTKGGGRYAALIVPHETSVSPELAKALKSFADARIPIVFVGGLPRENVSFRNMQQDRELVDAGLREVSHAANAIQTADGTEAANRVARIIPPQLRFASGAVLPFVKRSIGATHFYLLTNPTDKATDTTVEISEAGAPELWDPWTGDVQKLSSQHKSGHVSLDVLLPPFGSELLGFSKSHLREVETAPVTWTQTKVQNVGEAGWDVDATGDSEKGIGIDLHVTMAKLTDWLNEPSMRTFSGRATYVTHITVSADDLKSANRIVLDLGEVKDAAEVKINGVAAAALVVHPFTTDVRSLLHEGDNEIEVTVVNSLTNYASTIQWPKNPANPIAHFPPISAGLLGPVLLEYQTESNPKAPSATAK
jgi:hypothetical protein